MSNKATVFFSDGIYGWSETYYDANAGNTLVQTMNQAIKLMTPRVQILATGPQPSFSIRGCGCPQPVWIRVSKVGAPRQSIFATPGGLTVTGQGQATANDWNVAWKCGSSPASDAADNPYSGLLFTATGVNGSKSRRVISGVPDAVIADQAWNNGSTWAKNLAKFFSALTSGAWGGLETNGKLTPTGGLPAGATALNSQLATVPGITQNPNGSLTFTPAVPIPVSSFAENVCANLRIALLCEKSYKCYGSLNGLYRVVGLVTNDAYTSFTTLKTFKPIGVFFPGYIVPYQPDVDTWATCVAEGPDKRDRGRPFGLRRGRSAIRR